MGYSCTAKANFTQEAIEKIIADRVGPNKASNCTLDGGFWEIGRENADGSITGKVWRPWGTAGQVVPAGSFKIDAEGKVVRFPGLPPMLRKLAEVTAANRYAVTYGGVVGVSSVSEAVV